MIEIKRNAAFSDKIVYEASVGGEVIASAEAFIDGETLFVRSFNGENELFDGVCRALMNYGDHNGAKSCTFNKAMLENTPLKRFYGGCEIKSIADFFNVKACCGGDCSHCAENCSHT